MRHDEILTADNWQAAAMAAIEDLPQDIRDSVGFRVVPPETLIVGVAVEPVAGPATQECEISRITLRYWQHLSDEVEWAEQEFPNCGNRELYTHLNAEQLAAPSLSMESDVPGEPGGSFTPGKEPYEKLHRFVQLAVLGAMYEGGGFSMVCRDRKGRYFRDDGSLILAWQRKRKW